MQLYLSAGLAALGLGIFAPSVSTKHGGRWPLPPAPIPVWTGPTDTGPSLGAGFQPSTPTTGGSPSLPGPGGPGVPSGRTRRPTTGSGTGRRAGPSTGGQGSGLGQNFDEWQYWWALNRDYYLQLKSALRRKTPVTLTEDDLVLGRRRAPESAASEGPSSEDRRLIAIPALERALRECRGNRRIVSACLIALAKLTADAEVARARSEILPLIESFLGERDQETRETAALALGVTRHAAAVPTLVALAEDRQRGRELCGRVRRVDWRTRSFACYGLGLVAEAHNHPGLELAVFESMERVLRHPRVRQDVAIAAWNAIRNLAPDGTRGCGQRLQHRVVNFATEMLGSRDVPDRTRAHGITAVSKVLGKDGMPSLRWQLRKHLLGILVPKARYRGFWQRVQVSFRADHPAAFRVLHITSQRPDLR